MVGVGVGCACFAHTATGLPSVEPGRYVVEGEVRAARCGGERCVATLELAQGRSLGSDAPAVALAGQTLRVWSGSAWVVGERVRALVGLGPPVEFRNPGMPEGPPRLPSLQGSVLDDAAVRVIEPAGPRRWLERLRAHVRRALVEHTAPSAAAVARALVLGESMALSDAQREAVRGAGLAHLVAVSGLHMALLAGLLHWLMVSLVRRSPLAGRWPAQRLGAVAGILFLPAAVCFAGAAPSAIRAGLTAGLAWLVALLGRRAEPVAIASATVLVCVLGDPALARRPGFLLSVAATAGLLRPARGDLERPVAAAHQGHPLAGMELSTGLRASFRTWLATAPIAAAAFGSVSPWALVSNLVGVPFATLLWVPLALLHALLASCLAPLAFLTAAPFELSCRLLVQGCALLPAPPGALSGVPLSTPVFLLLLAASAACLWAGRTRLRLGLSLACLSAAACVHHAAQRDLAPGELEVTFLDVGQGDAAVLRTGEGQVALIDVGGSVDGRGPDPGARSVVPWLRAHGVERVDLIVLSHPHPDHVGGLPAVLEAFPVAEVWDTGQAEDERPGGPIAGVLAQARARGARVRSPAEICGEPQPLGSVTLRVWAPCPRHDPGYGPNDNSFVVEVRHGARRLLFPGDAERAQESALVRAGQLGPVDVLKVAHHGSRTSSQPALLRQLSPALAVISCGRHNRFGHPHADALARLRDAADHVWRIDQLGGVRVRSDGTRLRVDAHDPEASLSLPDAPAPGTPLPPR